MEYAIALSIFITLLILLKLAGKLGEVGISGQTVLMLFLFSAAWKITLPVLAVLLVFLLLVGISLLMLAVVDKLVEWINT